MSEPEEWCLIESDPGIFTELIKGFGVTGAQIEELWSLAPEQFQRLKPVHGLIFLFKWTEADRETTGRIVPNIDNEVFFAKQMINNACATQALINILMNCEHKDIDIGNTLRNFKEFCNGFEADAIGHTLSNSEVIKNVHNSFARQQLYEVDNSQPKTKSQDNFHFVGYIPVDGMIYEIDGLHRAPIYHARVEEGKDWIESVRPVIEARMQKYSTGEIHFNLMAVVSDLKMTYQRDLVRLMDLKNKGVGGEDIEMQIVALYSKIAEEEAKTKTYKKDNIRRKHNFLPLIIELLKQMAKEKQLTGLLAKAKDRSTQLAQQSIK